jgi:hypothetical protein
MEGRNIKQKSAARNSGFYQNKRTTHNNKKHASHQPRIDFVELKERLKPHILTLLSRILPGGKTNGNEYIVLNPTRADRNPGSFLINIKTGMWIDFATKERGDIIALWAYVRGIRQIEAARELQSIVGGTYV